MNARYLSRRLRRFVRAREAVSTLEYAMLVGLMAVAVGAAILTFSNDVQTAITNIGDPSRYRRCVEPGDGPPATTRHPRQSVQRGATPWPRRSPPNAFIASPISPVDRRAG